MTNLVKFGKTPPEVEADLEAAFLGKLLPARGTSGDKSEWLSGINAREINAKLKVRSYASTSTWIQKIWWFGSKFTGAGIQHQQRHSHPTVVLLGGQLGSAGFPTGVCGPEGLGRRLFCCLLHLVLFNYGQRRA